MQIVHDHTASGSRPKLRFWDQTISGSSSTAPSTALQLLWSGDSTSHAAYFSGNCTVNDALFCTSLTSILVAATNIAVSQEVSCAEVILNGVALSTLLAAASTPAPSAGDVLKSTRTCMNPHTSITVANSGSTVCSSLTYTPVSAQSTLNVIFTGSWLINGATNGHGQWYCSLKIAGVEIGTLKHGTNLTIDTLDASPIYGQYINSATSALTIEVVASRHYGNQTLHCVSQGGSYKTTWFHIEEVAR